ncbi:hypothetical protein A3E49_00265 [Candidatus Saccharibacteria bacterium RIFCSPHIGHO2_12_FULL_49_19]|nr:MAG: hypothetical protein A2708_00640 [Candidatus Saccharibacteria bacterium RIFCSPHIGHO2_01_FULL_49_21]OGL37771.1 MAG: hypothetical protein A3E49_00265 [Candidatus Saccharibacteria bacterium RIFCSPHIGHO2_12_FULL_49_19]OGL38562.1 MAG: hypothetical protein A3B63_02535 [Candidatus Saccharibacteria bacterium RIFCSPLOWO2_01_FULL_49_22]
MAEVYLASPTTALLITGAAGSGKFTLARAISAGLLQDSADHLDLNPNFTLVQPHSGQSEISIDAVRNIRRMLALKKPDHERLRLIVFENADRMSEEAQNALLKTLEEPPTNTTFILTSSTSSGLLPTIVSRTWNLSVQPVSLSMANSFYEDLNTKDVQKAWSLSGGAPGLFSTLLSDDASHPLKEAVDRAKRFISSPVYERIIQADQEAGDPNSFWLFLEALLKITTALHRQSAKQGSRHAAILLKNRKLIIGLQKNLEVRANYRLVGLELALSLKSVKLV